VKINRIQMKRIFINSFLYKNWFYNFIIIGFIYDNNYTSTMHNCTLCTNILLFI